jgi:hypothetical protein
MLWESDQLSAVSRRLWIQVLSPNQAVYPLGSALGSTATAAIPSHSMLITDGWWLVAGGWWLVADS